MHPENRIIATAKIAFRHRAVAIFRQIMLGRIFARNEGPRDLVISTGRAATTFFFMKHLAKFIQTNNIFGGDGMTHLPRLPIDWLKSLRVLYVYTEPETVFRSIRRRHWLHMHAGELRCLTCQFTWGRLRQTRFECAVRKQIGKFHAYQSDNVMLLA
jgi:hypothetical protein